MKTTYSVKTYNRMSETVTIRHIEQSPNTDKLLATVEITCFWLKREGSSEQFNDKQQLFTSMAHSRPLSGRAVSKESITEHATQFV
jgi:hypothetical protein